MLPLGLFGLLGCKRTDRKRTFSRFHDPPPWLQRKMALVLRVTTEYINYLLSLNEPGHKENLESWRLVERIYKLLPRPNEGERLLYQTDMTGYTQQKYSFRVAYADLHAHLRNGVDAPAAEVRD